MNDKVIASWQENAKEWISVISEESIPSRKFTNKAIIDAIKDINPKKAVDIGCGEGWLTRKMTQMGIKATGIDAIDTLLDDARKKGPETFVQMTFEELTVGKKIPKGPFDLAVFNFCLYKKNGIKELLEQTAKNVNNTGSIIVQTLHPYFLIENKLPYTSQWLDNSWKGLPGNFINGHSWYARTIEDWITEFNQLDKMNLSLKEVTNNDEKPISIIFTIQKI